MSLIEVLMALGLGLFILTTVYAGFQVALNSIKEAERLALENKLLSAGIFLVLEDTDTWATFDRPGHQPLLISRPGGGYKTIDAWSGGYNIDANDWQQLPQPFTPFSSSWADSGAADTYDPDAWVSHDPRSWYRGDGACYFWDNNTYMDQNAFGNYGLFTNASADPVKSGQSTSGSADSNVNVYEQNRWYASQNKGLRYGLGWYGWFDYLPANAFIDYYDVNSSNDRACKPIELRNLPDGDGADTVLDMRRHGQFVRQRSGSYSPLIKSGSERAVTNGFYLYTTHLGISAPPPGATSEQGRMAGAINRYMGCGYDAAPEFINTFPVLFGSLNTERPIVEQAPEQWPTVLVGVRRFKKWGSTSNFCFVRIVDPISGAMNELSFPAIGTTLRGARINRGLD